MNKNSITYLLLAAVAFSFSLFFCNSKSQSSNQKIIHRDTSRILGCYIDGKNKAINYAVLYMITKDTLDWQLIDSLKKEKQWVRDTTFYIPVVSVDTLKKMPDYIPVIRQSVSIERNFDSAVSILQRFVISHPQYFPKPPMPTIKKDTTGRKDTIKLKNK